MFAAWSCRICTSIVFEISKEAYFSMRLYCPLTHPFLGFLLGKFCRPYCVFLHHRPGLLKRYPVDVEIKITFTDNCFCFFTFHMFSL